MTRQYYSEGRWNMKTLIITITHDFQELLTSNKAIHTTSPQRLPTGMGQSSSFLLSAIAHIYLTTKLNTWEWSRVVPRQIQQILSYPTPWTNESQNRGLNEINDHSLSSSEHSQIGNSRVINETSTQQTLPKKNTLYPCPTKSIFLSHSATRLDQTNHELGT